MQNAIQELLDKLYEWFVQLVTLLPNIVLALIVIVLAFMLARAVQRSVAGAMGRVTDYTQVNRLAATIGRMVVILVGFFIALSLVGLDGAVAAMLAGAGIVGLALGFAFQDIAANFISGVLLAIRRPFRLGDLVESNDFLGRVEEVNLRATHLRTFQGELIVVPNKEVLQNPLVNFSTRPLRRVDLACGVAYGDDLEEAEHIAREAIRAMPSVVEEEPVEVIFQEFGDSSIDFIVVYWVPSPDYIKARSNGIKRLKEAFDEAGLTIPFPIRTLDFGVVGGEKLSEAWPR